MFQNIYHRLGISWKDKKGKKIRATPNLYCFIYKWQCVALLTLPQLFMHIYYYFDLPSFFLNTHKNVIAVIVLGNILVPFVICFHTNSLKRSKSFYILFWSHYRYRYEIGFAQSSIYLCNVSTVYYDKRISLYKKKQKTKKDLIETKQKH